MPGDDALCRELVAASRAGTVVTAPAVIPAATLRRALLQPPGPQDHPTGQLYLRGVTVEGDLDLRGSTLGVQLTLIDCTVRGGINLLEATLPSLQLDRTTVAWVDAANCRCTQDVWLKESSFAAGVDFTDARVGGSMHLDGSLFGPDHRTDAISVLPRGCPVRMRRLTLGGMLSAPRIECRGLFDLANARVGGDLELDSALLVAPAAEGPMPGTALNGPELRIDGSLSADRRHERARRSIARADLAERRSGSSRTNADLLEVTGRFYLPGVVIDGIVDLSAGRFAAAEPPAPERHGIGPSGDAEFDPYAVVVIDGAKVRGNVELDAGFSARGSVRVSGAEIGGDLRFDNAAIDGHAYAIVANGVVVRGHVSATDATMTGEICLQDARIQYNVHVQRSTLRAADGNALNLHRAHVGGAVDCGDLDAEGSLRMADLVGGSVFVSGATLREPCRTDVRIYQPGSRENRHDPVLNLIGAEITGTVRGNPAASPFRASGQVALRGAKVSRSVQFIRAEIVSEEGPAVDASSLACSDLYLKGIDTVGGVRFADARISGDVDLTEARVRRGAQPRDDPRPSPSIDGGAAVIGGDAWFDDTRAEGLLRLRRAEVNRSVGLKGVVLGADPSGLVLDLAGLRTPDLVAAPGEPLRGNVDASRAVVISFTDNANFWHATHLDLLGFEYQVHLDLDATAGRADWRTQIERLRSTKILPPPSTLRTESALPTGQLSQPYLQLAATYRAAGADAVARRILFEMRRREWAQRTEPPRNPRRQLLRLVGFLYRITVGYGYRLQLALYWLLGLWLAGFLVFGVLAGPERPDPKPAAGPTSECVVVDAADPVPEQPGYCGSFNPALYSLDLLVPVVDLGQKSSWHYRDVGLQIVADILQIAGWILATAAATAALGLVGRGEDR
ncbi:hypothetical protein ACQP2F_26640 [Actinoplanes sp. CA-030573]|uniref:hypothetical protein n=1 Tax=Actinoplanes sp. CA-030573 TaxID=3239898 RepID=UPI003D8EC54E